MGFLQPFWCFVVWVFYVEGISSALFVWVMFPPQQSGCFVIWVFSEVLLNRKQPCLNSIANASSSCRGETRNPNLIGYKRVAGEPLAPTKCTVGSNQITKMKQTYRCKLGQAAQAQHKKTQAICGHETLTCPAWPGMIQRMGQGALGLSMLS